MLLGYALTDNARKSMLWNTDAQNFAFASRHLIYLRYEQVKAILWNVCEILSSFHLPA